MGERLTYTLRRGEPADIDAVLELWRRAGSLATVSDTPEGLRGLLARDPDALLVADGDDDLAGCVIATWDGWRGNFYRLAVDPRHRRRGLASRLVAAAEERLHSLGARRLAAVVDPAEAGATAFWTAAGYARAPNQLRFVRGTDAA